MITKNKKVSVAYELRTQAGGEIVETAGGETPFVFICGHNHALPKFEQELLGLKKGDTFEFNITAENAYGLRNEDMLIDLSLDVFEGIEEGALKVGEMLPMQDSLGRRLQGVIKEVSEDSVKMDFNHPLAGEHLFFTGKIESVEDATDEEIAALNSGCGGGCGSCSSGCGDHSEDSCGSGNNEEGGCCC